MSIEYEGYVEYILLTTLACIIVVGSKKVWDQRKFEATYDM